MQNALRNLYNFTHVVINEIIVFLLDIIVFLCILMKVNSNIFILINSL